MDHRVVLDRPTRGRRKLSRMAQRARSSLGWRVFPAFPTTLLSTEPCSQAQSLVEIPGEKQPTCPRLKAGQQRSGNDSNLAGKASPADRCPETWTTSTSLTHAPTKVPNKLEPKFLTSSGPEIDGFYAQNSNKTEKIPGKSYN
jgi:hypothetical protein